MLAKDKEEPTKNTITWVFDEGSFRPAAKIENEKSYSIITDYLGTPSEAYDESGQKVWEIQLETYGKVKSCTSNTFIPFRFQGQYEDVETGLYYNRFRYYSPEESLYCSQDPIKLEGNNPTLYSYVYDSNNWIDPFGLVETYYRTISHSDAQILENTGKLPGTTETTISPTKAFSDGYDGVTYEFTMKDGTTDELADIGVRDQSTLVKSKYPHMPEGGKGWNQKHARFKAERLKTTGLQQVNIGLGVGDGLDTFNKNIVSFKICT